MQKTTTMDDILNRRKADGKKVSQQSHDQTCQEVKVKNTTSSFSSGTKPGTSK